VKFMVVPLQTDLQTNLVVALFTRARDVQTGLPGESEVVFVFVYLSVLDPSTVRACDH